MKQRIRFLAVLALAVAAAGGAAIDESTGTEPGATRRAVSGDVADVDQSRRRIQVLCTSGRARALP